MTAHSRQRSSRIALAGSIVLAAAYSTGAPAQHDPATVTPEELRSLVAEHEGEVVVVNFWATWCPPCLREFPDIIEVYEDLSGKGLTVLAVSMNDAEEVEDIAGFIDTFEPPFSIYRAATVESDFFEGVLDSWFGEMPMTLIYDTNGELVHIHKKPLDYAELSADVTALLPAGG